MCYSNENMKEMGKLYRELLFVLNKKGNDPYGNVEIKPFYYLTLVIKQASAVGIPDTLNNKIKDFMDKLSPEDVEYLMTHPSPMEMRMAFVAAYSGY